MDLPPTLTTVAIGAALLVVAAIAVAQHPGAERSAFEAVDQAIAGFESAGDRDETIPGRPSGPRRRRGSPERLQRPRPGPRRCLRAGTTRRCARSMRSLYAATRAIPAARTSVATPASSTSTGSSPRMPGSRKPGPGCPPPTPPMSRQSALPAPPRPASAPRSSARRPHAPPSGQ